MAATAVQSRGRVMASLTVLKKFALAINADTTCCDIEVRLNKLDELWREFQEQETQVAIILANNPAATVELKQEEFEAKFFDTKSKLLEAFRKKQPPIKPQADNNNSFDQLLDQQRIFLENLADRTQAINERSIIQSSENVKLPHVSISKFSGEYEAWPSFYDLYTSSVHNVTNISQVHKFQILRGLLIGPPLNIIRNFLVTEANYTEAWDKLVQRYNKKRPILNSLIDRFFELPSANTGSPQTLRQISDSSDEILRGIKSLGSEAETRDPWLIRILLSKVDDETRIAWANQTLELEVPTAEEFLEFLNNRCYSKESAFCDTKKKGTKPSTVTVKSMHSSSNLEKCPCCNRQHYLWRCRKFKEMTIENRRRIVKVSGVCYNCLRKGHEVSKCPTEYSCRRCNEKHSTLLHLEAGSITPTSSAPISSVAQTETLVENVPVKDLVIGPQPNTSTSTTSLSARTSRLALLPTALIHVHDSAGQLHVARALLDSGSQSTFISETLVQKLNLARSCSNVVVTGISETKAETSKGLVKLTIQSRFEPSQCYKIEALILSKLTSTIPQFKVEAQWVSEMQKKNLQLADPTYYTPSKIDVLFGADMFFDVLLSDKLIIRDQLIAQSTKFGWVISGAAQGKPVNSKVLTATIQEEDITRLLERFWQVEEVPAAATISETEARCESHFVNTHSRNNDGRYVVRLPFRTDSGELGYSKSAAINRLISMERKFKRFPNLQQQYSDFMSEYLTLGHMHEVPSTDPPCQDTECFYLPHHAVIKNDSTTTKLRVVFDGSCKSSSGVSLNDRLLVGPTIQKDLVSIITLFRKHAIAFSSDVEKMYRQIEVSQEDQNYQRIIWRNSVDEPMRTFRLNTVTYGTSCAPFLAVRTLHQIAEDYKLAHPVGSQIAKRDFYVDDCLSGADSIDDAKVAIQDLSSMLTKGGFNLRKWKSNSAEVLNTIASEFREKTSLRIDDSPETVKTLGLQWNPTKDTFSYKIKLGDNNVVSKREMLSKISRIFDPLGWVSPAVITFKMVLQKLWLRKLDWDDPLPEDIMQQWMANQSSLQELESIEVPRFLMTTKSATNLQIHGFCDASEHAYAAVVYLRSTHSNGTNTRIVVAKPKVAPLKQVSLPRLELCGAVLLSRLINHTERLLEIDNVECFAWTDSKIVLSWLSDVPRRWKSFIGNRTAQILENTPRVKWNYVASRDNPADIASRGATPTQFLKYKQWWNGPGWLLSPVEEWPSQVQIDKTNLEERQISLVSQSDVKSKHLLENLFVRVDSYMKIKRILARILRWRKVYRNLDAVDILKKVEKLCVLWAQSEEFKKELQTLKQKREIGSKSKLISLSPFIDSEGILRIGGRLDNLDASLNARHPMLLPGNHILCAKIINDTHIRYLHPGPTLQTSIIRQKYWVINCRNIVRHFIHKCLECRRQRAVTSQQLMGNLPSARITPSRPFLHTGVDYAGPLYIKSKTGRGRSPIIKGYICIFVCFATKAVHIELCHDMTAEAYIAALRRFISRRGIPLDIMSDNGTNFVGAKRKIGELYELYQLNNESQLISNFISQNEIKFILNPANAPHFGGLWESGVKSIKHHLKRVTRNTMMTSDEMQTLLIQIEGILNSRPLCPMSNDVDDLCALTPAHFLIGEPITAIPEPSLDHLQCNRLSRWQNVQARMQGFWKEWRINYLHTLQHRRKWNKKLDNVKVGDFVLLKEDNMSPSKWPMGRIVECHPGKDGLVRVVSIKTSSGIVRRPIVKICQLISDEKSSNSNNSP